MNTQSIMITTAVCFIAPVTSAAELIPVEQERFLEIEKDVYDEMGHYHYGDYAAAADFGRFDESIAIGSWPTAQQVSEIAPEAITGTGSTKAGGYWSMSDSADSSAESYLSVTFDLDDSWTYMKLNADLSCSPEYGWGIASVGLLLEGVPVLGYETDAHDFDPDHVVVDHEQWLAHGRYELVVRAHSSEGGFEDFSTTTTAAFGFEMSLLDKKPCGADCFPPDGGDGTIDVLDLIAVLSQWGETDSPSDVAPGPGDGMVDVLDLLEVLSTWGPCG